MIPPPTAVAALRTKMPNRSMRREMAAKTPDTAKAVVPNKSKICHQMASIIVSPSLFSCYDRRKFFTKEIQHD